MISVNYKLREYIKMLNYLQQTLEKTKELSKKLLMSFKDYILIIQTTVTPYLKSMLTWTCIAPGTTTPRIDTFFLSS